MSWKHVIISSNVQKEVHGKNIDGHEADEN